MKQQEEEAHKLAAFDDLLAACEAAERIVALAEFPSIDLLEAGRQSTILGPQIRAALQKAKGER